MQIDRRDFIQITSPSPLLPYLPRLDKDRVVTADMVAKSFIRRWTKGPFATYIHSSPEEIMLSPSGTDLIEVMSAVYPHLTKEQLRKAFEQKLNISIPPQPDANTQTSCEETGTVPANDHRQRRIILMEQLHYPKPTMLIESLAA